MQKKHRNISDEQITLLQQAGLVHAGFDASRNKQVFHRPVNAGATDDPKMLAREYFNNTRYDLVLRLHGPRRFKPGSLPARWEFSEKPFPTGAFCFCPHGYYSVSHRDGTPFEGGLHTNLGDRMFRNETLLSPPEAPKARVFRKS